MGQVLNFGYVRLFSRDGTFDIQSIQSSSSVCLLTILFNNFETEISNGNFKV